MKTLKKKLKVNTTFLEFIKTRKFRKEIEIEFIEETYWQLEVLLTNGIKSILITTIPDSDDFKGQHSFDKFLEWFMCSTNPYYKHHFNVGLRIFIRDKISTIELVEVVKEVNV